MIGQGALIGLELMGPCIAARLALNGIRVNVYDVAPGVSDFLNADLCECKDVASKVEKK
jgi:3-hydroxyisobutyrate dehydrogenase-like beta-hydroxyacid dehydrogenase